MIDEAYVALPRHLHGACHGCQQPPTHRHADASKSSRWAGIRFGYAVGHGSADCRALQDQDSYNLNAITQALALAALNDLDYMQRNVARIIATRKRLTQALTSRHWRVRDSATNFIFAEPPGRNAAALFERLRADGIFIRYFPGATTGTSLRITIGTDEEIDTLIAALDKETP